MSALMLITEAVHHTQGTAQVAVQFTSLAAQTIGTTAPSAMASDGILDLISEKLGDIKTLLRLLALVVAVGFVIMQAISSRGAMSRIVISGLSAAVFCWVVFNVTDVQDRVDNEINGAPAITHTQPAHQDHQDHQVDPTATSQLGRV